MSDLGIIRFEPDGLAGTEFETWEEIDPASLLAGTPVQRGHYYHELPELGYCAGVWNCTAMTSKVAPYDVNEFMWLLEGAVTIAVEGGEEVTIRAGECFAIPQGLPCSWKQTGRVRKYFVIFEDKSGRTHADRAEVRRDLRADRLSGARAGPDEADETNAGWPIAVRQNDSLPSQIAAFTSGLD